MLEPALLGHDRVPGDPLLLRLDDVAVEIGDAHRIFRQNRDLAFAEEKHVARMLQDRRNVGRDKKLAVAQTDHDRRPFANRDDRVRLVDGDDRQREDALQFLYGLPHRFSSETEPFVRCNARSDARRPRCPSRS